MYPVWILWLFLLSGGRAFMIYSSEHSLCLQDSGTREVQLERCSLDSEAQQWLWINQSMLMSAATSRCLYTQWSDRVQMQSCHGLDPAGLEWDCYKGRLISRKTSLLLTASGQQVILSQEGKLSMWKSLDEEDFCEERLRLRRASGDLLDYEEDVEEVIDKKKAMTEEQRQFLRWFYRKEDSTAWKFVLLGLSFICLLFGFLLLGMGAMANKSRKKIAKYKAAALKQKDEELQVSSGISDNGKPSHGGLPHPSTSILEDEQLKAGGIVVKWKDGNTSCLYSDPMEEEKQEKEQTEIPELEEAGDDEVKIE